MNENEYVKVELGRYEDLIIAEERLRALEDVIYKATGYSEYSEGLRIDDDKSILNYLSVINGTIYKNVLFAKKEEHKNKNKE